MTKYTFVLITTALVLSPRIASAQKGSVQPGNRIRVTEVEPPTRQHSGTLMSVATDTLVLKLDDTGMNVAYPHSALSKVELSAGMSSNLKWGVQRGRIVGVVAGAVWGVTSCNCSNSNTGWKLFSAASGMFVGAIAGMGVGAILGSRHKTESWEELPPQVWRVGVAPTSDGKLGLSLSLRF